MSCRVQSPAALTLGPKVLVRYDRKTSDDNDNAIKSFQSSKIPHTDDD